MERGATLLQFELQSLKQSAAANAAGGVTEIAAAESAASNARLPTSDPADASSRMAICNLVQATWPAVGIGGNRGGTRPSRLGEASAHETA